MWIYRDGMTIQLRGGFTTGDPRMDWLPEKDPQSRRYGIATVVPATTLALRSYTWACPLVLDQGVEGACAGFSATHELIARPFQYTPPEPNEWARELYWQAQRIDPWPGGAYPGAEPFYEGTSILAVVKTLHRVGFYTAYHWAFSEPELALGVSRHGPAIIGIPWYEGMMNPDADGYLQPTGQVIGGHAILDRGFNLKRGHRVHNSWGRGWGDKGCAWISRKDMARLLSENGEACLPTRAKDGAQAAFR